MRFSGHGSMDIYGVKKVGLSADQQEQELSEAAQIFGGTSCLLTSTAQASTLVQ